MKTTIKKYDSFVEELYESEVTINEAESKWWNVASEMLFGPAALLGKYMVSKDGKKVMKKSAPALFGVAGTKTGADALKLLLDVTPVGTILNMSKAAASGDANGFKEAWAKSEQYTKKDLGDLKKQAFADMKGFGEILKACGIH